MAPLPPPRQSTRGGYRPPLLPLPENSAMAMAGGKVMDGWTTNNARPGKSCPTNHQSDKRKKKEQLEDGKEKVFRRSMQSASPKQKKLPVHCIIHHSVDKTIPSQRPRKQSGFLVVQKSQCTPSWTPYILLSQSIAKMSLVLRQVSPCIKDAAAHHYVSKGRSVFWNQTPVQTSMFHRRQQSPSRLTFCFCCTLGISFSPSQVIRSLWNADNE
jgi:hypothetical protein